MKNLKKAELAVIALTLLCLSFSAGYFIGRGTSVEVISFDRLATPSEPAMVAEPADTGGAAGSLNAASAVSPVIVISESVSESTSPPTAVPTTDAAAEPVQQGKININTAPQSKLEELPGIGPVLARSIIDYRDKHGGFDSIEQIMDVDGIGEKKFAAMKDMITIGKG
jgi:comEA protein